MADVTKNRTGIQAELDKEIAAREAGDAAGLAADVAQNAAGILGALQEDIAAATGGAISIATFLTTFSTDAGGDAFTLADGTFVNQMKKIQMIADAGGDGTVTPVNLQDGTTLTFADIGDVALLKWEVAGWKAVELNNMADGVTAPVLA